MRTILSKALTVSSKFQITIPQHVRELMKIQQNDEVVFTTDGKNVFFEKTQREDMYDKLITFARYVLQQGHHLYITGGVGVGKSVLAHEIASYEFNNISYFGNHQVFEKAEEKIFDKVEETLKTHTSTKDVVILDEYQRLQHIGVDLDKFKNYPGALMAVAQRLEFLPLPINKKVYHIHISNKVEHFDFELKLYEPMKDRIMTLNITLPDDILNAVSMLRVMDHVKKSIVESKYDKFFEGQALAVVDEVVYHMKKNDLYKVKDVLQMVSNIRSQNLQLDVKFSTNIYHCIEKYLLSIGIK